MAAGVTATARGIVIAALDGIAAPADTRRIREMT
jgi:hypothetical protein